MAASGTVQRLGPERGDYLLWIEGLPRDFTWQKLKDLARKEAPMLGWVEMAISRGSGSPDRGWLRLRERHEAHHLYEYLEGNPIPGQQLRVYLWLTTNSPPTMLACNSPAPSQVHQMPMNYDNIELSPPWGMTREEWANTPHLRPMVQDPAKHMIHQQAEVTHNMQASSLVSVGQMYPIPEPLSSTQQRSIAPPQAQQATQPSYVYSGSNGLPINVSTGCVPTVSRGVFISGLNHNTSQRRLEHYLRTAGDLEACEIRTDTTGASKGYAFARFATTEAALNAVELLDGKRLEGWRLLVRLDKKQDSLGFGSGSTLRVDRGQRQKIGVVIANGSTST